MFVCLQTLTDNAILLAFQVLKHAKQRNSSSMSSPLCLTPQESKDAVTGCDVEVAVQEGAQGEKGPGCQRTRSLCAKVPVPTPYLKVLKGCGKKGKTAEWGDRVRGRCNPHPKYGVPLEGTIHLRGTNNLGRFITAAAILVSRVWE